MTPGPAPPGMCPNLSPSADFRRNMCTKAASGQACVENPRRRRHCLSPLLRHSRADFVRGGSRRVLRAGRRRNRRSSLQRLGRPDKLPLPLGADVREILVQEWVYLKTHSWLGARIDRATEVFEKAGADVADFGKNAIELAVSTGEAVSQVITAKRPEVWVAVGAPPGVRQRSLRKRMTRDSPPESAPGRASFRGGAAGRRGRTLGRHTEDARALPASSIYPPLPSSRPRPLPIQTSMREILYITWPGVAGGLLALVWFLLGYQSAGYVTLLAAAFVYFVRKWRSPNLY